MLVLSRKPDEVVHFPQLGISVCIISVNGRKVRVGIDAPRHIDVCRGELASEFHCQQALQLVDRHKLANCLNSVKLGLHLAERQYAMGMGADAEVSLRDALNTISQFFESESEGAEAPPRGSVVGKHVLLVEDDHNECRLLAGLLELEGYRVTTAANGIEALHHLSDEAPDFILLDMIMPRLNGPQTLEQIRMRREFDNLKIFSISGTPPEKLGVAIGPDGVNGWFPKPLEPGALLKELRSLVGSAA